MKAVVVVLFTLTALASPAPAAPDELPVRVETDVVFSKPDGVELMLDYALPARGRGPFPAVLCIHGGGWKGGNREVYRGLIRDLAARGLAAATASYRLTGTRPWPAQLRDVRAALAWMRDNAARLDIDPHRIGAMGHSAGGHLSLMLGVLPDAARGEGRLVEAVVNFFGPADLTSDAGFRPDIFQLVVDLAGGPPAERGATYRSFSPVTYVGSGDAPVLTFHGDADDIVPVDQARILHRALEGAGIVNRVEILEGKGHGWGGEDSKRTAERSVAFLDAYLRGSDLPLVFADDFDEGAGRWKPTDPAQWSVARDGRRSYLAMVSEKSAYEPKVRSPFSYTLLEDVEVTDFVFDVSVQYTHRDYGHASLCLFFGWQDPEHFYYVHLGKQADAHANSIFIVNGEPRVSIAKTRTDGTDWDRDWHRVRIRRDVAGGGIEVFFDDMEEPVMTAADRTFAWGKVGVGTFDDKGNFDTVRLRGARR